MNSYNLLEISESTIDAIVDIIINETIRFSDIQTLENKKNKAVIEAKNLIRFLTDKNSDYQKILKILQEREALNLKMEQLLSIASENDDKNLHSEINGYIIQKKFLQNQYYEIINGEKDIATEIYYRILNFQFILNDLLGQKEELYYILPYYNQPLVYKLNLNDKESIKKFLTARYNKENFTGAFQISKTKLDKWHFDSLSGEEYDTSSELSDTYAEVMKRYKKSKKNNSTARWIFWKTGGRPKWEGIKVGQRGDINEAYAIFFFKKKDFIKQANIDKNVGFYALEGIRSVDNISGLLQGDISLSGGRELSIKSPGASLMSFKQVIDIAQEISNNWEKKSIKEVIKDLLNEKLKAQQFAKGDRHKLYSSLDKEVQKEMKKIIEQLAKTY